MHRSAVVLCALLVGVSVVLDAQAPAPPAPQPAPLQDPLHRESPLGTVTGFSAAVHRNDLAAAVQYLQLTQQSSAETEDLARDLSELLDRYFTTPLTSLSRLPSGAVADGLDPDRDRLLLTIGHDTVDLFLIRITDPTVGGIWLFSSDSLARVPELHRSRQATWVEQMMPETLVSRSWLGVSFAQWILWAASIVVPWLFFWLLARLVGAFVRRSLSDSTSRAVFAQWWKGVRWLLVVALTLLVHLAAQRLLGFSPAFRRNYLRVALFLGVVIGALLIWRVVAVTFRQARVLAMRRGRSDTRSLILLTERVVKVLVIFIAVFAILTLAGVDTTTALAGLGIVGVAVALGAQKTVENLLGAIFLLTDRALAVGDYCRLADREGWVEDITLRSVRLRTLEQTLLSVPAGVLSQGSIENFTARSKILMQSTLRLRYGTSGQQIQNVLDSLRGLFTSHKLIDKETLRVRLIAFGPEAMELEIFAYIATADIKKFFEVRENLLLQVGSIVESSGAAFAEPVQLMRTSSGASSDTAFKH